MKVILLRDVARIGRRYEIKEVPSGHALNFLIPRKLAEPATPENLKKIESLKTKQADRAESESKHLGEALKRLEHEPVVVKADSNEQGHLFKGIHANDIAKAMHGMGITIDPELIHIPEPIKAVGTYTLTLGTNEQKGTLTLQVTRAK